MKRDLPQDPAAGHAAFARQVSALAAVIRDDGVEPARDLWPDIERALGAGGAVGRRGAPGDGGRMWPGAALAATVLLAIGLGVAGLRPGPADRPAASAAGGRTAPDAAPAAGPTATREGLRAVEQALSELQAALGRSPDDTDLSRLVLLIHHSRGRLLRLQADGGVRDAHGGRI